MKVKPRIKNSLMTFTPEFFWKYLLKRYYLSRLKACRSSDDIYRSNADLQVIQHLVSEEESVFDIGANFGFFTLFFSQLVGGHGRVFSFEPIPLTYEFLSYNLSKMHLDNVKPYNWAISDRNGAGIMEIPRFESGGDNYYMSRIVSEDQRDMSLDSKGVILASLDSNLYEGIEALSFMKIDVEGHELSALRGSRKILDTYRPALYVEVSGDPDELQSESQKLFSLLYERGYSPYWFDGIKLNQRTKGISSVNYFFLLHQHLKRIPDNIVI